MTVFSAASPRTRATRTRAHLVPIVLSGMVAVSAVALVAYLLWPTWGVGGANAPDKLPMSVGGTLFNVPTAAIRMKIQRHSGPQERIDLDFLYPSLEPPGAPKHVTADTVEEPMQPIDRIFLSIAAHHDALAPEQRVATIYPRYLDQAATMPEDGLTMRTFRGDTPYGTEDLISGANPILTARCTRDAATPGMCLSERRVDGADLTFRFPRSWLSQWREVASAMDRLTVQLRGPKG
ncbi:MULTISPECIES: hypothetical protein [Bradyrhizobium]|uniref:Uncharacterized protein n=1 Tax=Bradyrhizobium neotropicale TaxID=1497615 RepID=A0A176ZJL1_9BRAD|nr:MULTISPECIES: hypothetical protein [Bradyrhizobium]OAF19926.1 hypothetical protein AXW67_35040 [Bradyrhizobium neotropicale]